MVHRGRSVAASFATLCASLEFNDHPWSPPADPLHYETGYPLRSPALAFLFFQRKRGGVFILAQHKTRIYVVYGSARHDVLAQQLLVRPDAFARYLQVIVMRATHGIAFQDLGPAGYHLVKFLNRIRMVVL